MNPEPDDDVIGEVEISFIPRRKLVADLGIAEETFSAALLNALEEREALADGEDAGDELPPLEEMLLNVAGVDFKLGDLAQVDIAMRDSDP